MADQIQLRGGTAAEWVAANPILAQKEPGVETDTYRMKIGNGTDTWTALPYTPDIAPHNQLTTSMFPLVINRNKGAYQRYYLVDKSSIADAEYTTELVTIHLDWGFSVEFRTWNDLNTNYVVFFDGAPVLEKDTITDVADYVSAFGVCHNTVTDKYFYRFQLNSVVEFIFDDSQHLTIINKKLALTAAEYALAVPTIVQVQADSTGFGLTLTGADLALIADLPAVGASTVGDSFYVEETFTVWCFIGAWSNTQLPKLNYTNPVFDCYDYDEVQIIKGTGTDAWQPVIGLRSVEAKLFERVRICTERSIQRNEEACVVVMSNNFTWNSKRNLSELFGRELIANGVTFQAALFQHYRDAVIYEKDATAGDHENWAVVAGNLLATTTSGDSKGSDGWGNDAELNSLGYFQRFSLSENQYKRDYTTTELDCSLYGYGWTITEGDFVDIPAMVLVTPTVFPALATCEGVLYGWKDSQWNVMPVSPEKVVLPVYYVPANVKNIALLGSGSSSYDNVVVLVSNVRVPGTEVRVYMHSSTGSSDFTVAYNSEGNIATRVWTLLADELTIPDGQFYFRVNEYDTLTMVTDTNSNNWQVHAGSLVTMNSAKGNYWKGDGWGNPPGLNAAGYIKRYTLNESEYHATERIYELDAHSTGLGIAYSNEALADLATLPGAAGEWIRIVEEPEKYYYRLNGVWNLLALGGDGTRDLSLPPYIAGTNKENSLLLKKFGNQSSAAFVMLPDSSNPGYDFKDGDVYRIKCGDAVDSDSKWLTVVSSAWGETNGGSIELPNDNFDREVIAGLGNTIAGYPNIGFKISEWENWEFVALPSRNGSWTPVGGQGVLFSGDGRGDGWGNAARVNTAGYLARYTLSEHEYNHALYHNHQAGIERDETTNLFPTITTGTGGDAGKIQIATGNVWMYDEADMDSLSIHTIAASGYLTLTDDSENFICADRDTDTWVALTAISDIDNLRYVPYVMTYKRVGSSNLHTQLLVLQAHGEIEQHHKRVLATAKYDNEPGALENLTVADTTLAITLAGGGVWTVNYRYAMAGVTTATRQFECINTIDGWQYYSHTAPIVRNLMYNDPTLAHLVSGDSLVIGKVYRIISRSTLDFTTCGAANNTALTYFVATTTSTLGAGDEVATGHEIMTDTYWGIIYVWRGIENEDHLYTIRVPEQFATLDLAKASKSLGELPPLAMSHALMVGRVLFQKGQTTNILCESAFDTVFQASSSLTSHTALSGLGADDHTQYFNQTRGDARYVQSNTAITGGTGTKVTYDAKGLVTSTTSLSRSDLPAMTATEGGAVPTPPNNTTQYLRGDGTFATPPDTNTTYSTMTATVGGLVPTPPNNTTTFLRGDGTFAAPAAPVIGANTQIAYNDNGTMAGDGDLAWDKTTNHLEVGVASGQGALGLVANTNDEVAEPGQLVVYAKSVAGRVLPKWIGPSGVDTPFQSSLAMNRQMICMSTGTAYSYLGCSTRTDTNGSSTQTAMTTGSIKNQLSRVVHSSGAVAAIIQYSRHSSGDMSCYLGNAANMGGFFFVIRFGIQALVATNIAFVGLSNRITPTYNANLNTYTNIAGVGYQTNTGNWFLVQNNGSGTGTLTDLGATMPLNTTDAMELVLYAPSNSTTVQYRLTNMTTGAQVTGTLTDPPSTNTLLTPMTWVSNNATASAAQIWVNKYSIETDY